MKICNKCSLLFLNIFLKQLFPTTLKSGDKLASLLLDGDFDFSPEELSELGETLAEVAYIKNDPKMAMVAYSIKDILKKQSSDLDVQKQAGIF